MVIIVGERYAHATRIDNLFAAWQRILRDSLMLGVQELPPLRRAEWLIAGAWQLWCDVRVLPLTYADAVNHYTAVAMQYDAHALVGREDRTDEQGWAKHPRLRFLLEMLHHDGEEMRDFMEGVLLSVAAAVTGAVAVVPLVAAAAAAAVVSLVAAAVPLRSLPEPWALGSRLHPLPCRCPMPSRSGHRFLYSREEYHLRYSKEGRNFWCRRTECTVPCHREVRPLSCRKEAYYLRWRCSREHPLVSV